MRIESASTITGCPDLWVQLNGDDYFIELKYCDKNMGNKEVVKWRPGQQSWSVVYQNNHMNFSNTFVTTVKHSWTFVGFKDCVAFVLMDRYRQDSCISKDDKNVIVVSNKELSSLNIKLMLKIFTYDIRHRSINEFASMYQMINHTLAHYIQMCGVSHNDVDMPDAGMYIDDDLLTLMQASLRTPPKDIACLMHYNTKFCQLLGVIKRQAYICVENYIQNILPAKETSDERRH